MSKSKRIQTLPIHLANQIAAGEVIERPASIVKELIENSVDAGGRHIRLEIKEAGSHLIKVQDDGVGIHQEDLALALSRHATSKFSSGSSLSHIDTLGFRGEALPSIASVSRLCIISKQSGQEHAWHYDDLSKEKTPIAHPNGTTITVRELFFNLPARKRFLRGDKTELNHIITTLYRLALSHFSIAFDCSFSPTQQLKLAKADTYELQQQRIAKLCGQRFIDHSLYISQQYQDISLHGWISDLLAHRAQTDIHYFFINGRVIRDRVINHAIRQAYSQWLPEGRFPGFVLYLTMPLDQLDVNVHPTKHEVRFRESRLIHGLLFKAIDEALTRRQSRLQGTQSIQADPSTMDKLSTPDEAISVPDNISEGIAPYQQGLQVNPITISRSDTSNSLLYQRYLLVRDGHNNRIIDLKVAQRQHLQKQFRLAFECAKLSIRPLLVPLSYRIKPSHHNSFQKWQQLLASAGMTYQLEALTLNLKTIPSLLAGSDLNRLMHALKEHITEEVTATTICDLIEDHVVGELITSLEQAEKIYEQIKQKPLEKLDRNWCCDIDESFLEGLFPSSKAK